MKLNSATLYDMVTHAYRSSNEDQAAVKVPVVTTAKLNFSNGVTIESVAEIAGITFAYEGVEVAVSIETDVNAAYLQSGEVHTVPTTGSKLLDKARHRVEEDYGTDKNRNSLILYTKSAIKHLRAIDNALHTLYGFSNVTLLDTVEALEIEKTLLIAYNQAYTHAFEILFSLGLVRRPMLPEEKHAKLPLPLAALTQLVNKLSTATELEAVCHE